MKRKLNLMILSKTAYHTKKLAHNKIYVILGYVPDTETRFFD
jgi:hypothetical protein